MVFIIGVDQEVVEIVLVGVLIVVEVGPYSGGALRPAAGAVQLPTTIV